MIYEDSSRNALWAYMLEYFVQRYEKLAKEKLHTEVLDTQLKFSIRHYCYGSVGMTSGCYMTTPPPQRWLR